MCISYDAVACQVWLDPISMAPAGGQPLCADHAQRLSAPRGWVILDRRTSQSALVTSTGEAVPVQDARGRGALPRRRIPRGWGQFDAPRLEFLAEDEPVEPLVEPITIEPLVAALVEPDVAEPVTVEPAAVAAVVEPEPLVAAIVEPDVAEPVTVEPAAVESEVVEPELQAETVAERSPEPEVESTPEPEGVVAEPMVVEPEPEPEPERVAAVEPEPRPRPKRTRSGENGPLGKPKGRLLSRAFEQSGHQRSAITESLESDRPTDS